MLQFETRKSVVRLDLQYLGPIENSRHQQKNFVLERLFCLANLCSQADYPQFDKLPETTLVTNCLKR